MVKIKDLALEQYPPNWQSGIDQNSSSRSGFEAGAEWAIKYILSTDAIVSMHDALLGHHPIPDALAKWDNLHERLDE